MSKIVKTSYVHRNYLRNHTLPNKGGGGGKGGRDEEDTVEYYTKISYCQLLLTGRRKSSNEIFEIR